MRACQPFQGAGERRGTEGTGILLASGLRPGCLHTACLMPLHACLAQFQPLATQALLPLSMPLCPGGSCGGTATRWSACQAAATAHTAGWTTP